MNNRNFIIVSGLLILISIVGINSYLPTRFETPSKIKMSDFPKRISDWTGTDIPLSKLDYEILETTNLVLRRYTNPLGNTISLFIIYSDDNRKVTHPPEVCYMGSGATIVQKNALKISPKIVATKMITENNSGRQISVFWYKAGDFSTDTYISQQLRVVWNRTFGKKTSAALIRISIDTKEENEQSATKIIQDFCNQIEPLLSKYVP